MAASNSNISMLNLSKCINIAFGDSVATSKQISAVWYADASLVTTKIWELAASESLVTTSYDTGALATFTPITDMTVASFDMISSRNSTSNYASGVYEKYISTTNSAQFAGIPVTNGFAWGTDGCSVTDAGIRAGMQLYKHTKTYSVGSRPTLLAGKPYYFHIGPHYMGVATSYLGGSALGFKIQDWSCSGISYIDGVKTGTSILPGAEINSVYLNVIAG